ncbi:MAG: Rne/Rng family ribonuclease [Phycisphaerae bacterium]|nr:Rne/Rng family ribonuclease [Phycisphaerae bacterium]
MIINVSGTEECRIAVIHEGQLEELFLERASSQSHVGNIYKGRVTNIEPGIQAAFIDFGLPKQGFLHVSDVQPQYFPSHSGGASEEVGRKIPRLNRPPIQKCFRRGQEVIVQVTREGVGTKGPTLTTYLSIPGRFLVMMPGMSRHGVSRKIEDDQARRRMRDILNELELPSGMGFILRTAGLDRNKRELQRDLNYLQRLWKTVADRIRNQPAPAELYRESDLVTRTIRDIYSTEFNRMVVDDEETAEKAREFLQLAMPRSKTQVDVYTDREPVFHRYGIEQEIERINMRHVPLSSGGSLVIESTEAMVTIDVNSGRFRSLDDAEETAYRINMEAAGEIARQLRLRDLGGLILCDFIDMRYDRHIRAVEKKLRDDLKKHKERVRMLRMSAFGIVEMTRQRQRASIRRNMYYDCPHCRGAGVVKMPESVVLDVMRMIQLSVFQPDVHRVTISVDPDVAMRILNTKRAAIARMESESGKTVIIRGDANFTTDQIECACEDSRGQPVNVGWQMKTTGK